MSPRTRTLRFGIAIAVLAVVVAPTSVLAQELEPRVYAVTPAGTNFMAVGYAFSTGAVFMDPALPVEDIDADVHLAFARYTRTLSLFDRPAKIKAFLPWSSGRWVGTLEDDPRSRSTTGTGDARITIETLYASRGSDAKTAADMAAAPPPTLFGARLQVVLPTGTYDRDRLINLGSNRWVLIPEFGGSRSVGRWNIEGAVGAWLFGKNDDFASGNTLEQDPLVVAKAVAVRTVRRGFWYAVAAGYGYGGRTYVNGERRATIQRNWRLSATVAYPLRPTQGISVSLRTGGNFGAGNDFDAIAIAWQVAWTAN